MSRAWVQQGMYSYFYNFSLKLTKRLRVPILSTNLLWFVLLYKTSRSFYRLFLLLATSETSVLNIYPSSREVALSSLVHDTVAVKRFFSPESYFLKRFWGSGKGPIFGTLCRFKIITADIDYFTNPSFVDIRYFN